MDSGFTSHGRSLPSRASPSLRTARMAEGARFVIGVPKDGFRGKRRPEDCHCLRTKHSDDHTCRLFQIKDKCLAVFVRMMGHHDLSSNGNRMVFLMACRFKKNTFCPMGDQWPCRTADCPPIMSRSDFHKHDPFSKEFVIDLQRGRKRRNDLRDLPGRIELIFCKGFQYSSTSVW